MSEDMPEKMSKQMSRQMISHKECLKECQKICLKDCQKICKELLCQGAQSSLDIDDDPDLKLTYADFQLHVVNDPVGHCVVVELLLRLFVCTSWGITRHLLTLFLASLLFILSDILSGISSEMISDSLSGVSSDNLSDILCGPPDILSGILAQLLTFCLTLFAYVPSFCLTFFPASLMSNSTLFYPCT